MMHVRTDNLNNTLQMYINSFCNGKNKQIILKMFISVEKNEVTGETHQKPELMPQQELPEQIVMSLIIMGVQQLCSAAWVQFSTLHSSVILSNDAVLSAQSSTISILHRVTSLLAQCSCSTITPLPMNPVCHSLRVDDQSVPLAFNVIF